MRLDDYLEGFEPDLAAERRRLAAEKSYAVLDHIEAFQRRFESVTGGGTLFGSAAPSVFVGRSSYPSVGVGILSPVGQEDHAAEFATSGDWYHRGLGIEDILGYRVGLLNSSRSTSVDVHDVWDGFVGVQREVAIASRPVDVEIGLSEAPRVDISADEVATPVGPRARAKSARLTENPRIPRPVEKTLEDDDWHAQGAMVYLYRRGFDVYEINRILSVGALGRRDRRKLVPTRWSITAVDDAVGEYLRGRIRHNPSVDGVTVWMNEYIGNRYWVVLAPGTWEFELVEMKSPGSVWNPAPAGTVWMGSAYEGYEGRTGYVEETAGAYYAARFGVLEHLHSIGRQAKCLVIREVSDDYWAPVGVWQIRESIRDAFGGDSGEADTFHGAVKGIVPHLPVPIEALRRKSQMVSGLQSRLVDFG